MKKVRFESPIKTFKIKRMEDSECHSPRPLIERQVKLTPNIDIFHYKSVPYTNDSLQIYECSNSSPFPRVSKTHLSNISKDNNWSPSNELELSTLDCVNSNATLRKPNLTAQLSSDDDNNYLQSRKSQSFRQNGFKQILTPIENIVTTKPADYVGSNDDFFLKKDGLKGLEDLQKKIKSVHSKENNPLVKKKEIMSLGNFNAEAKTNCDVSINNDKLCRCHHCVQVFHTKPCFKQVYENKEVLSTYHSNVNTCPCVSKPNYNVCCPCNYHTKNIQSLCNCSTPPSEKALNTVEKKTWAIEKYEEGQKAECLDLELQNSISKQKREPTVADLFKIIKLQNEQLQLLQKKVDDFISTNKKQDTPIVTPPIKNYVTEHIEVESVGTEQKISIGVMTSFEMVRTSTIINKEIVQHNEAQIQCNRSQISIKEIVSKSHPVNLNFLDGLTPVPKDQTISDNRNDLDECVDVMRNSDNLLEDKTLNEMSLYNVQVDNPITPLMSPEPSLYLDVRDYSDSDASSDDQSNVGWTYYNKVMTHVNGILQESDMPSSASALYRKARQKCLQIDKTNVSVGKRVTFGDDPLNNPQMQAPVRPLTDTSLKMNQLAAKYLKKDAFTSNTPSPKPTGVPVDMSLATRNYMEKHKIIKQGTNFPKPSLPQMEIPRFLDITALKQQPKLL